MDITGPIRKGDASKHWSDTIRETLLSVGVDGPLGVTVLGGAENGQFCWIDGVDTSNVVFYSGKLCRDEIILEIQGQKVAGYTLYDLQEWLMLATSNNNPVLVKTALTGSLPKDLKDFLNMRFQKVSIDHDLQQTIRNNIYRRTVPCTTRNPRHGEVDGVDYKFLTMEEFTVLEKNGVLLESGVFDGNFYGTPKPPKIPDGSDSPFHRNGSFGNIVPGQHPSSEGKRRRNLSNIEADLQKNGADVAHLEQKKSLEHWDKGNSADVHSVSDHSSESAQWVNRGVSKGRLTKEDNSDDLPYGWEKIEDPSYGTYYIDHNNKKTQYEPPGTKVQQGNLNPDGVLDDQPDSPSSGLFSDRSSDRGHLKGVDPWTNGNRSPPAYGLRSYVFTKNPAALRGDFVTTRLVKSKKGLGFTIIGGDDSNEEFLQIKNIIPLSPAHEDGKLQRSDVLVYVNDRCVLGYSHQDIITLFQSISIGDCVTLEVCRGYPLPFDPDDPNNEIITTVAVTLPSSDVSSVDTVTYAESGQNRSDWRNEGFSSSSKAQFMMEKAKSLDDSGEDLGLAYSLPSAVNSQAEILRVAISRGPMGFGFTIADSAYGQKVRQILDRPRCKILQEGDILVEINGFPVKDLKHAEVVQVLKNCTLGADAIVTVQRGGIPSRSRGRKPNGRDRIGGPEVRTQWNEDVLSFQKSSLPEHVSPENAAESRQDIASPENNKHSTVKSCDDTESKPSSLNLKTDDTVQEGLTPHQPHDDIVGDTGQGVGEGGQLRNQSVPPLHNVDSLDLSDQHRIVHGKHNDLNQHCDRPDGIENYGVIDRVPSYDYGGYGLPQRNYFAGYDDRAASSRQELVAQTSFNEYEKRPAGPRTRSKTPGPDMMRNRVAAHDGNPHRPGRELRSKTPTQELMSRMAKPISGTPDFIPASRYQMPRPSSRPQANDPGRVDRIPSNSGYGELSPVGGRRSGNTPAVSLVPGSMYGGASVSNTRSVIPSLAQLNQQQAAMRVSTSFENGEPISGGPILKDGWVESPGGSTDSRSPLRSRRDSQDSDLTVHLVRQELGFGFRIVGGTEEGSQVSVGHIVPGGAADVDGHLRPGDEITYIDNICVIGASHHKVVQLIGQSSNVGHVVLRVRRRPQSGAEASGSRGGVCDVALTRRDGEGFGFVIISSVTRSGSIIGKLVEGSPADRCGKLHVGDQLLAVNHVNITQMLHEQIVNLIKESGHTVMLTIAGTDDTSSLSSSATQRSASVPPASLGFQTQSDSDMSRQSEYSPYHNPRIPPFSREEAMNRDASYQPMSFNPQTSASDIGQSDKFLSVELQRGSRGFGFSIRGGKEFNNMSLFILKIAEGGSAHADGQLKVGDQIVEINGHNTNNMTHVSAIDLIQSCNTSIRLLVKRSGKPVSGLSSSQLPTALSYPHNGGIVSQDLSRPVDPMVQVGQQEHGYSFGQNTSQRYQASYR